MALGYSTYPGGYSLQNNLYNRNPSVVGNGWSIGTPAGTNFGLPVPNGGYGFPYPGGSPLYPGGGPPSGGPPGNIPGANAGYSLPTVGGAMQQYATSVNKPAFQMPNWTPAALAPTNPQTERERARAAKVDARKLRRASEGGNSTRGYKPISWSYSGSTMPAGAGPGGYFPGTSGEAQNRVRQDAAASFQQYAQGKGLPPRQVQQAVASILAGGSPGGGGGDGYGGGGNVGGMAGELMRQYQKARDDANAANESRYKDILGGRQDLLNRSLQNLMGMGQQEASDIERDAKGRQAAMRQSMVDRGLTNTTVLDTTGEVVNREKTDAMGRLNERIRQALLGTDERLSNQILGTMESRTDEGPADFNMLAQLLAQLGQAGPQGGGGGGGGSMLPPLLVGGGNMFGNPLAGMIAPMFGGALGARTNILNRGGGGAPKRSGYSMPSRPARTTLPAASMPRLPRDVPVYA